METETVLFISCGPSAGRVVGGSEESAQVLLGKARVHCMFELLELLDQAGQVGDGVGLLHPEVASMHVLDPGGLHGE